MHRLYLFIPLICTVLSAFVSMDEVYLFVGFAVRSALIPPLI